MASINKVTLIGRLGRDPEMRYTTDGTPVATFSLATSETWKDKNGEKQEKTEWHNIVAWRKLGEIAGEYLKKGKEVYLEGKIQSREYTDKEGIKRRVYEIIATEMKMLGSNGNGNGGHQVSSGKGAETTYPKTNKKTAMDDDFIPEIDDDDIPL